LPSISLPIDQPSSIWLPTLVLYLILAIASLMAAFKTRGQAVSQLRQQVNAWWYLFPLISMALYFYPYGPFLLVLLICGFAARELALHAAWPPWRFYFVFLAIFSLVFGLYFYQPPQLSMLLPLLLLAQLVAFWFQRDKHQLLILLFFITCYSMRFVIELKLVTFSSNHYLTWLFYLFVITALNDVAQFISGTCFGKQKIATRISPNKTWQGLAGGVVVSLLLSVVLGSYLQLADTTYLLLLAILLSLGGFAGDMLFSAAKRFLSIKDFSQLIPGHGGILDRVDSLVITAPLLYFVLYLTHNGFFK
jgi:phosphatidate cytidylyltransferase